jgi:hypothetical protein
MPMLAIFAEEAAVALAAELAPYAAGEAALAASSLLGAEALMGLGAEALGTSAIGGAEALAASEAMAANAAAGGAGAGQAGINAAQVAAQQNAAAQVANAGINAIPEAAAEITAKGSLNPATGQFINTTLPPEPVFTGATPTSVTTSPVSGIEQVQGFQGATAGPQGASPGFFNPSAAPGQGPMQYQLSAPNASQGLRLGTGLESLTPPTAPMTSVLPPPSPLEVGMDKAIKFAEKNPFTAMTGAYMGASALGLLNPSGATFNDKPYDGPLSRYKLSPNFQAGNANPANFQYNPAANRRYAEGGGIMGMDSYNIPVGYAEGEMVDQNVPEYAKGGSLSDSISQYQKMLGGQQQAAPARSADVGIYYDQDPDTRYQDALTAAQIRQAKVNQRAYVSPPAAKRPTPLGKLNMPTSGKSKSGDDVEAAAGGMMRSYAGGGITGSGNLDLHIPLDLGGGGGGGYTSVGGGFNFGNGGSGNTSVFTGQNNTAGGGFGGRPRPTFDSTNTDTTRVLGTDNGPRLVGDYGSGNVGDVSGTLEKMPMGRVGTLGGTGAYDPVTGRYDLGTAGMAGGRVGTLGGTGAYDPVTGRYDLGTAGMAAGGMAGYAMGGGISSLGGYAAGGNPRLLKGPGDGMSDNIPATINGRQPARLADGEFVIPADVVSHLGNGSTEAGAKHLHAMMDKVRKARTGNPKQGKQINAKKYMPK